MWSKTRQVLESRLAEPLKGRVRYQYDVYRNAVDQQVMSILVDGEPWFCTNPLFWQEMYKTYPHPKDEEIIMNTGYVGNTSGQAMEYIHQFLNVLSIDEAISHENYFIRLLAVLDARLGKRRIKALADNIDNEPEWFRKWILLRAGGMITDQTKNETIEAR